MKPRRIDRKSRNIGITEKFYRSVAIPIRISQISGCGPFSYSGNGIRKSILSYAAFILQIVLLFGILTIMIVTNIGNTAMSNASLGPHMKIVNRVSILSTLIIWILSVFKVEKWSNFLKDLVAIDHGLANFDISVDYGECDKWNYWTLAALTIQFSPFPIYEWFYQRSYLHVILLFFLPHWIAITLSHCVSTMVYLIYQRLQVLNSLLQSLVDRDLNVISLVENKKQRKTLRILCHVCSWHHNIIKVMTSTNDTFGLSMVIFFGYAFMVLVMQVFLTSQLFKKEIKWELLAEYLFTVATYSFTVYKICHICEYTVREAKKSGLLIHQIETDDFDMKDEIEMFSLQIANENIEFSAAGFFPIDYSLLFSIIGGVTTYIIILIQLDSSDHELSDGANSTEISSTFLTTFQISEIN